MKWKLYKESKRPDIKVDDDIRDALTLIKVFMPDIQKCPFCGRKVYDIHIWEDAGSPDPVCRVYGTCPDCYYENGGFGYEFKLDILGDLTGY